LSINRGNEPFTQRKIMTSAHVSSAPGNGETTGEARRLPFFRMLLLCGLSLSIGWGVRGNFGHEYGAMIPGALAAIAAVLLSGRADWWRRVAYFAMFGALGWSFGGSISYMWVIAYTHSGHFPSQVYGFACLAVIGFLWGALGGAGTALPAFLDRERLTQLFPPILAVFVAWTLQDLVIPFISRIEGAANRHESFLYWYDSDWIAAALAIVAVLLLAAARRRFCWGTSFILHLAVGWWIGFLIVVLLVRLGIEFRMTPPRGDNWAGILGMTAGALVYFLRNGMRPVAHAALVCGFFGTFGFATATFLKLVEVKYVPQGLSYLFGESTWQTNWHSILEQSYGFLNGIGLAVAMAYLARRVPTVSDEPPVRRWTEVAAVSFVLLAVTYVNVIKDVWTWVQMKPVPAIPADLYGIPSRVWFMVGYALLAGAIVVLLIRHLKSRIALVPLSWLGKGQLLFIVFLWWIVIGNLMRAIPPFNEQRLITEGVIHVNAVLCTLCVLLWPRPTNLPDREGRGFSTGSLIAVTAVGLILLAVTVVGESYGTRAIHGSNFVGHAGKHTRFGPDAQTGSPKKGEPHP
jgi:hypothetical protein